MKMLTDIFDRMQMEGMIQQGRVVTRLLYGLAENTSIGREWIPEKAAGIVPASLIHSKSSN
jgi:hypothetical protein